MPKYTLHGADELSCADAYGRAYTFTFPFETDSPELMAVLIDHGAMVVKDRVRPDAPLLGPLKHEEKKGGDA